MDAACEDGVRARSWAWGSLPFGYVGEECQDLPASPSCSRVPIWDPESRAKWRRKGRLAAYGLTPERFDEMLAEQGNACAMCREPFKEGRPIVVDHDHSCCDTKLRSCGKCVRGLLCHPCNIALGQIELKSEMARVYLRKVA